MKFSLKYLDKLDLIVMDELPPNYFKVSSHNQISALIGGIYSGNPASHGRNSNHVGFIAPTIASSNYK